MIHRTFSKGPNRPKITMADKYDWNIIENQISKFCLIEGTPSYFWLSSVSNVDGMAWLKRRLRKYGSYKKCSQPIRAGKIYRYIHTAAEM